MRLFETSIPIGFAGFYVMADAAGAIGMLECRPSGCARFEVPGDWFAQTNHARTAEMVLHDFYRSPDSFGRLAEMEAAVQRHLGRLTPALASEILRDRTGHTYPNAESVGNLFVLNAAVVQPAAGVLWHSTAMQPHAPFGAYRPFSPNADASGVPVLPASAALWGPAFARQAQAIHAARTALRAQLTGRPAEARAVWDELAAQSPPALDPARIALARAWSLVDLGDLAAADSALAVADVETAPLHVRLLALTGRAVLADRAGRRDEAAARYAAALELLDAHPEYTCFRALRALAEAGSEAPQTGDLPREWWAVGVPR
jgi:tetratricopeptide (TPR) repeat protein